MTDEEMALCAVIVTSLILRSSDPSLMRMIEPMDYFEEKQDLFCLVQQMIAEATGLVGTGDI